ncbi:efflux RND transporter periplasmic adaptor subunit [Aureibacter tunicatorum]|uniref:Cobalt-zinc-cadmium efflux system membrane fusion protein n=1 Tax=Aureibacter tunicatorum TaxID=866807 RepID=A0AAE4BUZ3_9BACT|nr:efflux RND transporter periplasmic adaptor subunit [Aureibacter tunicatorum]MDR6241332.1 cobalt-zinc-cadmium efflux system membrane fusion protein [Aureibacter tunicatorum]BDD03591.1 secretion protein HlyD [Aureibacter tunicatorum]
MKTIIATSLAILALSFSACQSNNKGNSSEDDHEHHHEEGDATTVTLNEVQMKSVDMQLGKIEDRNIFSTLKVTGELELPPQNKASVSPYLEGIVDRVFVMEGEKVRKGQVLAYLSQPEYIHLQDQYLSKYNELKYLKKEYERKKRLYEEKITSGKDFQSVEANYNSAMAKVQALKEKLLLMNFSPEQVKKGKISQVAKIISPIDGFITQVNTNVGKNASPQTPMFLIVNNKGLYLDLTVYENDLNDVEVGQKLKFTVANQKDVMEAEVFAINQSFEKDTKAVKVLANIIGEKKGNLLAGMYVNATIDLGEEKVPTLPSEAVITEGDGSYIFIVKAEKHEVHEENAESHSHKEHNHEGHDHSKELAPQNIIHGDHDHSHEANLDHSLTFEKVKVIKGREADGFIEVTLLQKLPKNTEVAINGAYYLISEMGKSETAHTH